MVSCPSSTRRCATRPAQGCVEVRHPGAAGGGAGHPSVAGRCRGPRGARGEVERLWQTDPNTHFRRFELSKDSWSIGGDPLMFGGMKWQQE